VLTGRHTCCGLQVLDARDPLACRCPDVERYIRSISHNKRIILLLNKMDLVPREVGEKWLAYFRWGASTAARTAVKCCWRGMQASTSTVVPACVSSRQSWFYASMCVMAGRSWPCCML
jgi:hypothetical protein